MHFPRNCLSFTSSSAPLSYHGRRTTYSRAKTSDDRRERQLPHCCRSSIRVGYSSMDSFFICLTPNRSLSSFRRRRKPLPRVSSPHLWSSTVTLPRLYTRSCLLFSMQSIIHHHSPSPFILQVSIHSTDSRSSAIHPSTVYFIPHFIIYFFSPLALTDHSATSCVSFIYFLVPVAIKHILPRRKGILLHLHIIAFISSLYAPPFNTPPTTGRQFHTASKA